MSVVANVAINIDGKQAAAVLDQIQRKVEELNGTFNQIPRQTQRTETALQKLGNAASALASSFAFGSIVRGFNDLAVAATKFSRLEGSLKAVTGSAQGASAAMQAVYRSTAITGQSTVDAARGLTQMLVAARGTAFEGGKAVRTFEQINALTVAYAGDSQKAEKAQLALQQMMSKGVVSMEELRGQLGDAVPGAMELFRKAYKDGKTSLSDFIKLVGDGKVTINDFTNINKVLGQELDKVYGKGYTDYISKQAQFNQAMDKLKIVAGQVAIVIGTAVLPKITAFIKGVIELNPKLLAIAGAITTVAAAAIGLAAALSTINFALTTLGIAGGAKKMGQAFAAGMAGPPQIKALTLLAAAALGTGAALGGKAMVDEFDKAISGMQNKLKGITGANFLLPEATGDFDIGTQEDKDAARKTKRLQEELRKSLETGDRLGRQFSNQAIQLSAASDAERKRNEIQFEYEDRALQISKLKNQEQKLNLTILNDEIRRLEIIRLQREELKGQIDDFYSRVGLRVDQFGGGQGAFRTDINLDPNAQVSEAEKMKQKLDELVKAENQVKVGAEAMGNAFGTAFRDLISSATSAEQAFANLMQSIADHFLDMAAQIITQQITMIIYGTIMKALGIGGGGGLFSGAGPVSGAQAFGVGGPSFNPAAFGGAQLFAEGGFVTGPTRAVVGEAGNEYVIPASKMRGAMNRYAAGARGSAVIPAGDGGDGGTATMVAAPGAIDVRYTVERINSVDYVTADQFQQGMQQAAQQGAAQGEQRTLRRLQMSTSTRKRLGM